MNPDFYKNNGLVPAIIQDNDTGKVLMLGYFNSESYQKTRETGFVYFYSRSRKKLWKKGETSGHVLKVQDILLDCDKDTFLIKVTPSGAVCHTGNDTCFQEINQKKKNESTSSTILFIEYLISIIKKRKTALPSESYTANLLSKGTHKVAQKVGEEAVELVIEALRENKIDFKNEAADLLFHYLILLEAKNVNLEQIIKVLKNRHFK